MWVFLDKDINKNYTFVFVCSITYASKAGEKHIPLDWALGAFILDVVTPNSDYNGKSRKYLGF